MGWLRRNRRPSPLETVKKICAEIEAERDAVLGRMETEGIRKIAEKLAKGGTPR